MSSIAFIGVGAMGCGMAANQVKVGHQVRAFDLNAAALDRAHALGCERAGSASEAVMGADVVITMLPAGQHVTQVYRDDVAPNAKAGALLIDCSTIDVDSTRAIAFDLAGLNLDFADAPVSGGIAAASAGSLTFMVGCEEGIYAKVAATLGPMARTVVHAGPPGSGQAAKICNNMLLGISMLGVCEAFALAEKLGLAPEKFYDIASNSSGQCWSLSSYCPWPGVGPESPGDRGYDGGFRTALMLKDLKLSQEAAARVGAVTSLGALAEASYASFERQGFGAKDFSFALQLMRGHAQ